jgi:hypothetical protein
VQGNAVLEVGATIPVASIEGAPHEGEMVWPPVAAAVIDLPESMREQAGLSHLTVFWEAHGHPPAPFMVPHFDFHFYRIGHEQREAIDCSDTSKPAALPAGYILPDETLPDPIGTLIGICVPAMGMHSLVETEFNATTAFQGTMVVGYYRGEPIFIEPMIARSHLLERRSFDLPIPAVPGMAGPRPASFRAEYDAATQAYRFTFSGFSGE